MATDATGTPTTPDSIPTYNTAVDSPSGKGFNAAMAAIQTALSARVSTPAGIAANESIVWNGASWDRSTITKLGGTSIGTNVPIASLAGYPADGTKFAAGDGTWKAAAGVTYRKNTIKTVTNTIVETDLLNGEITIAAGAMGVNSIARFVLGGTWVQNAGAAAATPPRFRLKLGATTLLDTGVTAVSIAASATAFPWEITGYIVNQGVANVQAIWWKGWLDISSLSAASFNLPAVGTGGYSAFSAASANSQPVHFETQNAGAIDTTASQALIVTTQNGSATATYTVTLNAALVEII